MVSGQAAEGAEPYLDMSEQRYNVVLTGEISGAAPMDEVRSQLQSLFKLRENEVLQLLAGRPSVVKRGVNLGLAARYRDAFLAIGAEALIEVAYEASPPPAEAEAHAASIRAADTLTLAAAGEPLPQPHTLPAAPLPDISAMRLLEGHDWSLEDCQPPQPPPLVVDIGHLSIEPMSRTPNTQASDDAEELEASGTRD